MPLLYARPAVQQHRRPDGRRIARFAGVEIACLAPVRTACRGPSRTAFSPSMTIIWSGWRPSPIQGIRSRARQTPHKARGSIIKLDLTVDGPLHHCIDDRAAEARSLWP
jgi:hypothetical protein